MHDVEQARATALAGIRSLLRHELAQGHLDLDGRIDVVDEAQRLVMSVAYEEAVTIRGGPGPASSRGTF